MNTIRTLLVGICVMASTTSRCQETAIEDKGRNLEQRTWPAVSNGLVFVEGEFLPPPYIVSRVRNAIYINGRYIEAPLPWPSEKTIEVKPPAPPPQDPEIPKEITKDTTQFDPAFYNYLNAKRDYLVSKFGKQQAIKMLPDSYKKLPCIKDAYHDTNTVDTIVLIWNTGKKDRCKEFPHQRSQNNGTPEQAAKMFDRFCEIYSTGLDANDYFMFGSAYRTGTQDGYGQFLVPIAEAIKTAKDEEAFVSVMTNKFPMTTGFSEKAFRSFYKHKDKLPQWDPLLQKRCKGRQ